MGFGPLSFFKIQNATKSPLKKHKKLPKNIKP